MITAKIHRNSFGNITGFEISGHAGYAEEGSDIICAAVSAIAYTAAGYFSEKRYGGINPDYSEKNGLFRFRLPKLYGEDQAQSVAAQAVLEAFEIGLRQIELSYGKQYIRVID